MKLNQGAAEMVWVSPSTFRFRRSLAGPLARVKVMEREAPNLKAAETPSALVISTKYVEATVQKRGLLVSVRKTDGSPLMSDLTEARPQGNGVVWERAAGMQDRYFGLGPRADPSYELRGKVARPASALLISTAGFGEYHAAPGAYAFDMMAASPDRYRIEAPGVDYYFLYGPTPREIFEEAAPLRSVVSPAPIESGPVSWEGLRDLIRRLAHASMSGVLMPAFDLTPWIAAPAPLAERARQIAQITPGAFPEKAAATPFRKRLGSFFTTYGEEARDRGFPYFHPMPMQYHEDGEAARHADQFLLGDEFLVAPIYTSSNAREVWLPRGIWTEFATNRIHQGRRSIRVESEALPLFARNGTIIPLDGLREGDPMELHYFPSLGAEFFILETDIAEWTQAHAAPAADIVRLEVESKVEREYEWVVHHTEKPASVEFEKKKYVEAQSLRAMQVGGWHWDAKPRNLHVRSRALAGEHLIVNVIPPEK
jgi:hypothetical protein